MKIVKSLVALLAVIVIGVLVYLFVYKGEIERKAQELEARRLIRFDLDQVTKFTLVRPDSSVVFERGVGRVWNITSPIQSEADKEPIFSLFYSLDSSDILFEVENEPKDLKAYDLEAPDYFMAMEYDTIEADTIFVGSATPDNTMTYIRFASENRVLAVNNFVTNLITRPVLFYRSRSMLNIVPDDIVGIELDRLGETNDYVNLINNGIEWILNKPYSHPADKKNMEDFTKALSDTRKNTLVAEHADDLSIYGLDNPKIILTTHLKYGMNSKMIMVGDKLTERGKTHLHYAKQFDKDLVFTIENSIVNNLSRQTIWFIDKQPLKFNRNVVDRILLKTAQSPLTFMRDAGGTWSVVSPVDKNVEQQTINSIFGISRFILSHELYSYEPTEEELKTAELENPHISIGFYAGEQLLAEIYFGKSYTTSTENTYFTTNLSPIIYISHSNVNSSINTVLEEVFGG